MRHAITEAGRRGHRAILVVGDAPYYGRFDFSAEKTGRLCLIVNPTGRAAKTFVPTLELRAA